MLKDLEAILHGSLPKISINRDMLIISERSEGDLTDEEREDMTDLCDLFEEEKGEE
jgi:hypothetical protein